MAGVLEQIQQQIEELKAAISALSDRLEGLELAGGLTKSSSAPDTNNSHGDKKPVRQSGYVNWDESHDCIKNMKWMKIYAFKSRFIPNNEPKIFSKSSIYEPSYPPEKIDLFLNESTRFPVSSIYVNISDPEITYLMENRPMSLFRNADNGYEKFDEGKFLALLKNHMHTQSSFEEKYKLKWVAPPYVDPRKQKSIKKV